MIVYFWDNLLPKRGGTPNYGMYEVSLHFQIRYGVVIQNQAGAGLGRLGNFHDITRGPATSTQGCQTGTRSFQQLKGISCQLPKTIKKVHTYLCLGLRPLAARLLCVISFSTSGIFVTDWSKKAIHRIIYHTLYGLYLSNVLHIKQISISSIKCCLHSFIKTPRLAQAVI